MKFWSQTKGYNRTAVRQAGMQKSLTACYVYYKRTPRRYMRAHHIQSHTHAHTYTWLCFITIPPFWCSLIAGGHLRLGHVVSRWTDTHFTRGERDRAAGGCGCTINTIDGAEIERTSWTRVYLDHLRSAIARHHGRSALRLEIRGDRLWGTPSPTDNRPTGGSSTQAWDSTDAGHDAALEPGGRYIFFLSGERSPCPSPRSASVLHTLAPLHSALCENSNVRGHVGGRSRTEPPRSPARALSPSRIESSFTSRGKKILFWFVRYHRLVTSTAYVPTTSFWRIEDLHTYSYGEYFHWKIKDPSSTNNAI